MRLNEVPPWALVSIKQEMLSVKKILSNVLRSIASKTFPISR